MGKLYLISLILISLVTTACNSNQITVQDPWARPGIAGGTSAVYFTIDNPTSQDELLLTATTNIAENAELHLSNISSDGMMTMEHQESVPIPASMKINFQPGGLHVMLINLNEDLKTGDRFTLTLNFKEAGDITLDVPVKNP